MQQLENRDMYAADVLPDQFPDILNGGPSNDAFIIDSVVPTTVQDAGAKGNKAMDVRPIQEPVSSANEFLTPAGRLVIDPNGFRIQLKEDGFLFINKGKGAHTITLTETDRVAVFVDGQMTALYNRDDVFGIHFDGRKTKGVFYDGRGVDTLAQNIIGSKYADIIFGGGGDDSIDANSGADFVHAGDGNDAVVGGSGNDTIHTGTGANFVKSGPHSDTLILNKNSDTVLDPTRIDKVMSSTPVEGPVSSPNEFLTPRGRIVLDPNGFRIQLKEDGFLFIDKGKGPHKITITQTDRVCVFVDDLMLAMYDADDVVGVHFDGRKTKGVLYDGRSVSTLAQNVIGSKYADQVFGGGGDDTFDLNAGNDVGFGGDGADAIKGGGGADVLSGESVASVSANPGPQIQHVVVNVTGPAQNTITANSNGVPGERTLLGFTLTGTNAFATRFVFRGDLSGSVGDLTLTDGQNVIPTTMSVLPNGFFALEPQAPLPVNGSLSLDVRAMRGANQFPTELDFVSAEFDDPIDANLVGALWERDFNLPA